MSSRRVGCTGGSGHAAEVRDAQDNGAIGDRSAEGRRCRGPKEALIAKAHHRTIHTIPSQAKPGRIGRPCPEFESSRYVTLRPSLTETTAQRGMVGTSLSDAGSKYSASAAGCRRTYRPTHAWGYRSGISGQNG